MQYGMPRRWLFGSTASWIAQWPWTPDYQFRLVLNAPGVWRFPAVVHADLEVLGELSLVDVPLYHSDLLLAGIDERRAKRARYEARRPGVFNGQFPINGYYTPEDFGSQTTAPTPADDLVLIEAVHAGSRRPKEAAPLSPVRAVEAAEAETYNASRAVSPAAYRARVDVVRPLNGMLPGSTQELEVDVTNLGDESWTWGEYPPFFRLGYRWQRATATRSRTAARSSRRPFFPARRRGSWRASRPRRNRGATPCGSTLSTSTSAGSTSRPSSRSRSGDDVLALAECEAVGLAMKPIPSKTLTSSKFPGTSSGAGSSNASSSRRASIRLTGRR
jgi:hypothetical protein